MAITNSREKVRGMTIAYIITIISIILFTYPIVQFLLTSLKPTRGLLWSIWPESFTWQNYLVVLKSNSFQVAMVNSILIATLATIIVIGVGILAAHALSSFEYKQRENIAFFILSLYILPPIVTIIPTWIMAQAFGVLDQWWFLALVYAFCNLPFTVWLLRNFLIGVPKEIQEAALVDGCTELKTLSKVLIPIILPGLAVAAIFSFIFSWNEFLLGVVLTNTQARTIPVEIASQVSYFIEWGKLSSMTLLSVFPVLCLSIVLQRYLVMGLTLGSVKE